MGGQFYRQGAYGYRYEASNAAAKDNGNSNDLDNGRRNKDDDLIIEDNTIYEVDRECYERLKRQRKRREK